MSFTVAILGRPNVGKSTLFNRLVGKRLALVDDTPGVTRDRRSGEARLGPLSFRVVDTAGLEDTSDETMEGRMRRQTEAALAEADVALLLIDARAGVTPLDGHFARWVRSRDASVILVANKCEGSAGEAGLAEAYGLGLGDPVAISAEHGDGMADLYEALLPFARVAGDEAATELEAEREDILQLAIVGRPNAGKSTLINRLLGEQRLLTGPEPGLTRDAIAVDWTFQGQRLRLVDTAGQRRRAKVQDRLERLSTADARRATAYAHVVALLVDATQAFEKQDLTIARQAAEEGRALVIIANKWDLVKDRRAAMTTLRERVEQSLPQLRGVPVVALSALTGKGVEKLLPAALEIYRKWNTRVATAQLNRWLEDTVARHPPPAPRGRPVRLRYVTQAKSRPPTFVLFASRPGELPESYRRYLVNGLRETFDLDGVPIRLGFRKGKNPYARA